jgi:hypothetical protein
MWATRSRRRQHTQTTAAAAAAQQHTQIARSQHYAPAREASEAHFLPANKTAVLALLFRRRGGRAGSRCCCCRPPLHGCAGCAGCALALRLWRRRRCRSHPCHADTDPCFLGLAVLKAFRAHVGSLGPPCERFASIWVSARRPTGTTHSRRRCTGDSGPGARPLSPTNASSTTHREVRACVRGWLHAVAGQSARWAC